MYSEELKEKIRDSIYSKSPKLAKFFDEDNCICTVPMGDYIVSGHIENEVNYQIEGLRLILSKIHHKGKVYQWVVGEGLYKESGYEYTGICFRVVECV